MKSSNKGFSDFLYDSLNSIANCPNGKLCTQRLQSNPNRVGKVLYLAMFSFLSISVVPKLHAQPIPFDYGGNQPESHIYGSYPGHRVITSEKLSPFSYFIIIHVVASSLAKGWSGQNLSLLDPTYATKYIPIIYGVIEQESLTRPSYFIDINVLAFLVDISMGKNILVFYPRRKHQNFNNLATV